MSRYFVNTGDGILFVPTRDKAIAEAERFIAVWRSMAADEWPEEVDGVCWGEVLGESVAVVTGEHDEYCDYVLREPK